MNTDNTKTQSSGGFKRLLALVAPHKGRMLASGLLALLAAFCAAVPFAVVYLMAMDLLQKTASVERAWKLAVFAMAAILARFALLGVSTWLSHLTAYDTLYALRIELAQKLERLPLGYFSEKNTGTLRKILGEDVERIELFIAHQLPDMFVALGFIVIAAAAMITVDWRMTLAAIAVIPIALGIQGVAMRNIHAQIAEFFTVQEQLSAGALEYTQGIVVIKAFNQTAASFKRYGDTVRDYREHFNTYIRRTCLPYSIYQVLILANFIFVVPAGLYFYLNGSLELPKLILFIVVCASLSVPFVTLINLLMILWQIAEGEKRVNEILSANELLESAEPVSVATPEIEFRNVTFGYDERNVLKNICFTVKAGTMTALVGPSGSGKTTIARLIPRFWDVKSGAILLGGRNVKELPFAALMSQVSFIFQDVFLFNDTVKENIRIGKPEATDEEIIAAAQAARADEFIRALPRGYDTNIGEHGGKLSGGERQRLSIARAILKNAPIIILDEATAFTDPENEAAIQEAISRLTKDKTLIVIAHRLSTITDADQIVILNEGCAEAVGTHEALLQSNPLYRRNWRAHIAARTWAIETRVEEPVQQAR